MGERIVVVVNPKAAAGRANKVAEVLRRALERGGIEADLRRTSAPRHAETLVRDALAEGAEGVAVMGGDGTLNEGLHGFFSPEGELLREGAWLAPLPCGTGGDFRKTVGLSKDPEAMAARLLSGRTRPLDAGWLRYVTHEGAPAEGAFLNVASFGIGGHVDRIVNESPKWMGGRLSFIVGSLRAMAQYRMQRVRVQVDEGAPFEASILNLAVANGQYFGGGMHIAPGADPGDGVFEVVSLEREGALGQLGLTRALYGGRILEQEGVRHLRGARVHAEPVDPGAHVLLDVDGEAPGRLPATFEMRAGALRLR